MSGFPRLVRWDVENFMSIEKACCEFDERNIINLKGYNDSGKSAMLTALKVLMTNCNPAKQVGFIQDDKEYFRVLATFEDGVQILRDKYINGQSLYEMYKDGQLVFSTKSKSGTLTKVSDVPQPIADYLGLIDYDGTFLNARSCFEKQIGVQTTGSENYKMFNTVLKAEEIANASALLNTDKNKLNSDIEVVNSQINGMKQAIAPSQGLTTEIISYLKEHDSALDDCEVSLGSLTKIKSLDSEIKDIVIAPELGQISTDEVIMLSQIESIKSQLENITIPPVVESIDIEQLSAIVNLSNVANSLNAIQIVPDVPNLDNEQLNVLTSLLAVLKEINTCATNCDTLDEQIKAIDIQLNELQKQAEESGVKMVRCPDCGRIFNPDEAHVD